MIAPDDGQTLKMSQSLERERERERESVRERERERERCILGRQKERGSDVREKRERIVKRVW